MRFAILLLLSSCAGVPVNDNTCGLRLGGDYDNRFAESTLTQAQLQRAVDKALDATTFTTDFGLLSQTDNCSAMNEQPLQQNDFMVDPRGRRTTRSPASESPQWSHTPAGSSAGTPAPATADTLALRIRSEDMRKGKCGGRKTHRNRASVPVAPLPCAAAQRGTCAN